MHQILKTAVLEVVAQEVHQIQELQTQVIVVQETALATQLEIATNF